ncbi:SMC family ATPase [Tumidithrix elongata RA019]|uniref:Nuclease SbcCD subunit C n=1 Tax=Tumidithrix elongata BACA0141 TaxID=2716417 RepID=A0AAW9PT96_9CYAN|nr:SMC family ATPase [Tumidithrix elongata RA019]
MHLISLHLENFRQHKNTEIHFPTGLTGILGANGSGKSTILEAIAWALYGNQKGVARGDIETLIWRFAPGKSVAVAELTFAFNNQTFTVKRSQSSSKSMAELRQGTRTIANSTKAVNESLSKLLGMTHQEFFNSYFTGQKDLNFLGAIEGATDRERFIAKMLNYERITEVQGAANKEGTIRFDLREKERQKLLLEGSLGNLEAIQTELVEQQKRLAETSTQLEVANHELNQALEQRETLTPQLESLDLKRDTHTKLGTQLKVAQANLEQIDRQIEQLSQTRLQLAQAVAQHEILRLEVANYDELLAQYSEQDKLRQAAIKYQDLEARRSKLQVEIAELEQQLEQLGDVSASLQANQTVIAQEQTQLLAIEAEIQAQMQAWQETQADLKAKIKSEQQDLKKLETQKNTITAAGHEGNCPTCERPLEAEFDNVIGNFSAQLTHLHGHIQAWQAELAAIRQPPEALEALQTKQAELKQNLSQRQKQQTEIAADQTKQQLWQKQCTAKQTDIADLTAEIAKLPTGFDAQQYEQLSQQLQILKPKREEYLRSADAPQRLSQAEQQLQDKTQEQIRIAKAIAALSQEIQQLEFSEEDYRNLKQAIAHATQQLEEARQYQNQAQRDVALIQQSLADIQKREAEYHLKQKEFQTAKAEHALLEELDKSFTEFRQYLTEQIRPQLAESASEFLKQLTDGRYDALEIDAKYNVVVLDGGDRKPVISGGEEDIVNLCLRLAISQMITERSGQPFSLLILDEVFGSLDDGRRDKVLELLHGLERQFEQVLIITHIESIKESFNHTIRLEFDPKEQCSFIK